MSKKNFIPEYYFYENYSLSKKIECIIEEIENHCQFCHEYINKDIQENCPYCGLSGTKERLIKINEQEKIKDLP